MKFIQPRALAALAALTVSGGAAHAQLSGDAVKIGVLTDMSGVYSDLSGQGSVVAARMAVEDFGGELDGKPINILSADHQNKPDVGSNIARQWIDVEGVDMIIDVVTSSVALAVQEVTKDKNTVFIDVGAATTELTGKACSPVGMHWAYDTHSLAVGTGQAVVKEGGDTWFFITADYAFGHRLQEDTAAVIEANGGKIVGEVAHPLSTADFSSFLLQAQGSGAKVIGLANAGADTANAIKQANEFGIVRRGQQLAALLPFLTDIDSLGLEVAQKLLLTTGFYWDRTEETRAWSNKFNERHGAMPTMVQAGVYSGVKHYLEAIKQADSDEAKAVVEQMKKMPVNDMFAKNGKIRADGLMVHDMYLAQVKSPDESEQRWDYYNIVRTIPADQAFAPLSDSKCPLLDK